MKLRLRDEYKKDYKTELIRINDLFFCGQCYLPFPQNDDCNSKNHYYEPYSWKNNKYVTSN